MNVITILCDSVNLHYLSCYREYMRDRGVPDICPFPTLKTPNIDRLAARGMLFGGHFIGAAPCMPARRELMSGRMEMFWRSWGHLEPFDYPIAAAARAAGAVTSIVTDHYHYWENAAHGYFEHFDSAQLIRGHELDNLRSDGDEADMPDWARAMRDRGRPPFHYTRFYRNARDWGDASDYSTPRTFAVACDWLDKNKDQKKFLLWVESFDAHEPFYVPEPYRSMFLDDSYTDEEISRYTCWPPYQEGDHGHNKFFWDTTSEREVNYIRAQYAGKLVMLDEQIGRLLGKLDEYSLWDNTAVIFTTDHGHELGEKQRFGKQPPNFNLSAHIPLIVCDPRNVSARRTEALTTAVDLYPTILELLGTENPTAPNGRTLMPLVEGKTSVHRDAVVSGTFAAGAMICDGEYAFHAGWNPDVPVYNYSAVYMWPQEGITAGNYIPGVISPVWKIPRGCERPVLPDMLFDIASDPWQDDNLSEKMPDKCAEMRRKLKNFMDEESAPEEQYRRLGVI